MHTRTLTENRLSETDAVILCGGMGKRLRPVVDDRPKPMAEIDDRPFLDILIDSFAEFGLRRFILCAGYMSDIIRDYYAAQSGSRQFIISDEYKPLGTAGAIKNAAELIRSDTFLVANGDSFCPVDLNAFHDFHLARHALMSMVVVETQNTGDCGLVSLDASQRIVGFEEKTQQSQSRYINAGIYLCPATAVPPTETPRSPGSRPSGRDFFLSRMTRSDVQALLSSLKSGSPNSIERRNS